MIAYTAQFTVATLKEALDDYGDHVEVVFLHDTGDTILVYDEIDIDYGTFNDDSYLVIDVGRSRKVS